MLEEKMKQQTNISDESVIKSLRERGIDERSIAGEDELAKAKALRSHNKLDKISATSVECLNKVCDRMDLIEFIKIDVPTRDHAGDLSGAGTASQGGGNRCGTRTLGDDVTALNQ